MDTTTISNPHFAEGRQYPEYRDALFSAAGDDWLKVEPQRPQDGDCWGAWRYKRSTLVLEYAPQDGRWWYEVDLERCKTPAQMLDLIFQVQSHSNLISAQDMGYLIAALDDLLYPQNNLCSFGGNKLFDTRKYLTQEAQ